MREAQIYIKKHLKKEKLHFVGVVSSLNWWGVYPPRGCINITDVIVRNLNNKPKV